MCGKRPWGPLLSEVASVFKKQLFMTLKDGKADFIQDCFDSYRDHWTLHRGRKITLNSIYSRSRWDYTAREQGVGQWMENF